MDSPRSFGQWARAHRVAQRYSQDEIARKTGYSQITVSRAETGQGAPSADYVVAFAKALGIDIQEALHEAGILPSPVDVARQRSGSPIRPCWSGSSAGWGA